MNALLSRYFTFESLISNGRSCITLPSHHKIDQPYKDADDQNAGNNLFITGLAPETKEGDLENVFSKYGKVRL